VILHRVPETLRASVSGTQFPTRGPVRGGVKLKARRSRRGRQHESSCPAIHQPTDLLPYPSI